MRLGRTRLAQSEAIESGRDAVLAYERLIQRVPLIQDEGARAKILEWVGDPSVLGSPAERYGAVRDTLSAGVPADDVFSERVARLKELLGDFGARVANAEETYGTLSAENSADSTPEERRAGLVFAGSVALLGLIVAPLLLD